MSKLKRLLVITTAALVGVTNLAHASPKTECQDGLKAAEQKLSQSSFGASKSKLLTTKLGIAKSAMDKGKFKKCVKKLDEAKVIFRRSAPIGSGGAQETAYPIKPTPEQVVAAYTGKSYAVVNVPNRPNTTYFYKSGGVVDVEIEVPSGVHHKRGNWWVEPDSRFCVSAGGGTVCQETILSGDTIFAINGKTGSKIRPMKIPN